MKLLAVNFHYYRNDVYHSGIYPVSHAAFAHQIEVLSKHYTFVSQSEINLWIANDHYPEGNYCVITFDDGLKEQMNAFSWLKQNGIPAIFYVVTQPLLEEKVLPVNKLHYIRTRLTDSELISLIENEYPEKVKHIDTHAAEQQYRYDNEEGRKIKYLLNFGLEEHEKTLILNQCFQNLVDDEGTFARQLYMNKEDLIELAKEDMLGAHGHQHLPLAQVKYETAHHDILTSITLIENMTNLPVTSFAYPYGSKVAVNESLLSIFSETNVKFAFTMWRGMNISTSEINPMLLKRIDTNDAPGGKDNSDEFLP